MRHQCTRNMWVNGLGWRCSDCDPRTVATRAEAQQRYAEHLAALNKTAKRIYQTELRRLRKLGIPLAEAQRQASREACIAVNGYDPETE